jgi:hypothetical protein
MLTSLGILNGYGGGGQSPIARFLIGIICRKFKEANAESCSFSRMQYKVLPCNATWCYEAHRMEKIPLSIHSFSCLSGSWPLLKEILLLS